MLGYARVQPMRIIFAVGAALTQPTSYERYWREAVRRIRAGVLSQVMRSLTVVLTSRTPLALAALGCVICSKPTIRPSRTLASTTSVKRMGPPILEIPLHYG